jgi:N-acylneuraminate cytidylyltransferase/CMP-N,N'-diacetyllegionaminic acid synthase
MKSIITVCARGGSKGVKGKNVRLMVGLPLIVHTLRQAKAVGLFDAYAVSSDSDEILALAQAEGFIAIKRPDELATDTAAKIPVIRNCVQAVEDKLNTNFQYCIDLDCTSPLRNLEDIRAVYSLIQASLVPNVITAMPARRSPYFNLIEEGKDGEIGLAKNLDKPIVRRQDAPACYDMNASIYAWKKDILMGENKLFLKGTKLHVMPEERSLDIDSELDFEFVEILMKKRSQL